jgi:hypothetical protein
MLAEAAELTRKLVWNYPKVDVVTPWYEKRMPDAEWGDVRYQCEVVALRDDPRFRIPLIQGMKGYTLCFSV